MMIRTLAVGVALAVLASGAASAAPQGKAKTSAAVAGPSQPIPYAQLDAYLKASPKQRASKDWWSGSASTGMSADTSATTSSRWATSPAAAWLTSWPTALCHRGGLPSWPAGWPRRSNTLTAEASCIAT